MNDTAKILHEKLGQRSPREAIILGSSLGGVADALENPLTIDYLDLPGFPKPSISGHGGQLVSGILGGREIIVLQGRVHYYEQGDATAMRPVIEALAELGIETLIVTNAAGSVNVDTGPGQIMLITDHINFAGINPLIGETGDAGFVSMTNAYDPDCAERMRDAARYEKLPLAEGVYMWFSGPSFETPAEIIAARALGADAVGMSTVPETILARRFGLKVAGLSMITNLAAGIQGASPSHDETKTQGTRAAGSMIRLLTKYLELTNND